MQKESKWRINMKLNYASILNKPNHDAGTNIISIAQKDGMCTSSDAFQRRESIMTKKIESDLKRIRKREGYRKRSINNKEAPYLSIDVVRKMLSRLLFEKKMSHEELAKYLGISREDLVRLLPQKKEAFSLIPKINLPLIKLYCETKFDC